jgi:hypothetical protein
MQAKVLTVDTVLLQRALDQHYFIVAVGTASTSGWGDGALYPRIYIRPPEDGVWDWDFVAAPPTGVALDVISPIAAQSALFTRPEWMRGVRVHASANAAEVLVDNAQSHAHVALAAAKTQGGVDVWPWVVVARASHDARLKAPVADPHRNFSMDDLIGKTLRTYEAGDQLTKDYRVDRFNCELLPSSQTIAKVWIG